MSRETSTSSQKPTHARCISEREQAHRHHIQYVVYILPYGCTYPCARYGFGFSQSIGRRLQRGDTHQPAASSIIPPDSGPARQASRLSGRCIPVWTQFLWFKDTEGPRGRACLGALASSIKRHRCFDGNLIQRSQYDSITACQSTQPEKVI